MFNQLNRILGVVVVALTCACSEGPSVLPPSQVHTLELEATVTDLLPIYSFLPPALEYNSRQRLVVTYSSRWEARRPHEDDPRGFTYTFSEGSGSKLRLVVGDWEWEWPLHEMRVLDVEAEGSLLLVSRVDEFTTWFSLGGGADFLSGNGLPSPATSSMADIAGGKGIAFVPGDGANVARIVFWVESGNWAE